MTKTTELVQNKIHKDLFKPLRTALIYYFNITWLKTLTFKKEHTACCMSKRKINTYKDFAWIHGCASSLGIFEKE